MDKFINNTDPTLPIDTSSVNLEAQYTQLNERDKLLLGCKLLGMNHVPVDIKTFLFDDYFCGSPNITNHGNAIFPYWIDKLETLFPTPITTSAWGISLTGCVGSGKSFMSRMMGLYHFHRLDCCSNAWNSLGLAGGAKLAFAFFHASYDTAEKDFIRVYKDIFEDSPYFKNQYNKPKIRLIASGPRSTGAVIGSQLIYTVLSEIGFWSPTDAISKINEVIVRYNSRFTNKRFNFGGVICDSSAKDADHGASQKFEESIPEKELFHISPSHWEVRPDLYRESKGQTFEFYRGDSTRQPKVIEDGEDISELDKDRIIKVPIQSKFMFINSPVRSLQDLAGYGYSGKELFFSGDISHVINNSTIVNQVPDVIDDIDFYNLEDTIYSRVQCMIDRIPKHINIYLHLDLGLKKDITGMSICYFSGEKKMGDALYPTFTFPLVIGISRKDSQSTSIDHIFQFIKRLSIDYNVVVSADTFGSVGLFQSLDRAGIIYKTVSVDRTTDPCFMFKNSINADRVTLPYVGRLLRECSEVKLVMNGKNGTHFKIDHPDTSSCTEFDYKGITKTMPGTKDLFDSVCGALWTCYQEYSEYLESGRGIEKQNELIGRLIKDSKEESSKAFQGMIENIF